jgi:glycosyltransferase 2 family protein
MHANPVTERGCCCVTSEIRTVAELEGTDRLIDEIALSAQRSKSVVKYLFLFVKLLVTAACFWYVLRRLSFGDTFNALSTLGLRWIVLAVIFALAQLPLLALRLQTIIRILAPRPARLTFLAANALTAIYWLFAQVLPNVAGEGIRAWMLTRFGYSWRTGLTGVMIDRGTGVFTLCAFAFVILFLPSALTAFAGYRAFIAFMFGAALIGGGMALLIAPRIAPLLQRWRYSSWIGSFAADAHCVLLGPHSARIFGASALIHVLTILVVWSVGRGEGLPLSVPDCAVLFIIMVGVVLVPISVGGWGLREFAVVSLLGAHGVATERAFLFSLGFGVVFMVSALPGAVIYLLYPLPAKTTVADITQSSQ